MVLSHYHNTVIALLLLSVIDTCCTGNLSTGWRYEGMVANYDNEELGIDWECPILACLDALPEDVKDMMPEDVTSPTAAATEFRKSLGLGGRPSMGMSGSEVGHLIKTVSLGLSRQACLGLDSIDDALPIMAESKSASLAKALSMPRSHRLQDGEEGAEGDVVGAANRSESPLDVNTAVMVTSTDNGIRTAAGTSFVDGEAAAAGAQSGVGMRHVSLQPALSDVAESESDTWPDGLSVGISSRVSSVSQLSKGSSQDSLSSLDTLSLPATNPSAPPNSQEVLSTAMVADLKAVQKGLASLDVQDDDHVDAKSATPDVIDVGLPKDSPSALANTDPDSVITQATVSSEDSNSEISFGGDAQGGGRRGSSESSREDTTPFSTSSGNTATIPAGPVENGMEPSLTTHEREHLLGGAEAEKAGKQQFRPALFDQAAAVQAAATIAGNADLDQQEMPGRLSKALNDGVDYIHVQLQYPEWHKEQASKEWHAHYDESSQSVAAVQCHAQHGDERSTLAAAPAGADDELVPSSEAVEESAVAAAQALVKQLGATTDAVTITADSAQIGLLDGSLGQGQTWFFCISPDACSNPIYYWLGGFDGQQFHLGGANGPYKLDLGKTLYAATLWTDPKV